MRRALLLLVPATWLVLLVVSGCSDDESHPRISRIDVSPLCGVAPMAVECRATATGGNESGDPTGGNNNLEITWDFNDGGPTSSTSVAYHTFENPGVYQVMAQATDPDGQTTTISQEVVVFADSLTVEASSNFDELSRFVTVCDTINFDVWAESCDVDPDNEEHYRTLFYKWRIMDGTDTVFLNRQPSYTFAEPGNYDIILAVTFPELAITRWDTLNFTVGLDHDYTVPTMDPLPAYCVGDTLTVSWSDESASGAYRYIAEKAENEDFTVGVEASPIVTGLSHQFTDLQDGVTYFYRVRSYACPNNFDWSESVSCLQDNGAPSSEVLSFASPTSLTFDVPFEAADAVSGVASVELFWRRGGSGDFASGGTSTTSPISFTATATGTYFFYTRATDNAGFVEDAPPIPDFSVMVNP